MNNCIILTAKQPGAYGRSSGPYRLSSFLREHNWETDVVDYFTRWKRSDLIEYLKGHINENTRWIGISYTWLTTEKDIKAIREIVAFVKSLNPNILIIAGGQTPYEHDLNADYYIYGYAEYALLKVLDYEFNNGTPLIYDKKFNGKYVDAFHNHAAYSLKDYNTSYQENDFLETGDVLSIEFSRGCKFKCDFCTFPFIGIKEDTSTSEEMLYRELMTNYEKWGIKTYYVADETINDRVEKLIKIKNVVNRLPFKPDFTGFTRADLFRSHPEKIELMAEARIWGQYYGVETFNHESGKAIGKGLNPDYVKESILNVRDYFLKHVGKYRGTISMIAGLPHETVASMRESQQWLLDNWSDQSVNWWTLHIVNNGTLSAMGKDFKKYGYSQIENPSIRADELQELLLNDHLYWRNEHTDIFEVNDLVKNEFGNKFKLGNFFLWYLLPYMKYEDAVKVDCKDHTLLRMGDYARINQYIKKKKSS